MKSHKKALVAVYGALVILATLIVVSPVTAEAGTENKPELKIDHAKVCLVKSVTPVGSDMSSVTISTLEDDDTWTSKKTTILVPHLTHFKGEVFIGAQAPKGWILLDVYSVKNSKTYTDFIEKIHNASSQDAKVVLQKRLLDSIDRQKAREAGDGKTAVR